MLERFAHGPADPEVADAVAGADVDALLALVEELLGAGQRDHLELMGRPSFPKAVRKTAGRAAYRLRSAGVGTTASTTAAAAALLRPTPALDEVALIGAPGLAGRYWVLLAELPDAAPVAVETSGWGGEARVRTLERMSAGRLRHYEREMRDEALPGKPLVASASLAVRMLDRIGQTIRDDGGAFPSGWTEALWWRARAMALGARPDDADARRTLPPAPGGLAVDIATGDLIDEPLSGPHLPEQAAIDALIRQVIEATEGTQNLTRGELVERLEGLADASCDAYYADERARARSALGLEASADVLAHFATRGGGARAVEAAQRCLAVAEQLAAAALLPHEISLLSRSWRRIIDYEHAWRHHEARGAATDPPPPAPPSP